MYIDEEAKGRMNKNNKKKPEKKSEIVVKDLSRKNKEFSYCCITRLYLLYS